MEQQELVTIIIVAENELENLRPCLKAVEFCGWHNRMVIIINNDSDDGTQEWLEQQTVYPYVTMEEKLKYSELINAAVDAFEIQGHVLLLSPDCIMAPGCLKAMMDTLQEPEVGAVNCIYSDTEEFLECTDRRNFDYNEAIAKFQQKCMGIMDKRRVLLKDGCILFKDKVWQSIKPLDERFICKKVTLMDYMLELVQYGYILKTSGSAFAYFHTSKHNELYHVVFEFEADQEKLRKKRGIHYLDNQYNAGLLFFLKDSADAAITTLEIGCNCGENMVEVCNRYPNAKIYGYEINPDAARIAGHFGKVTLGDIEKEELPYSSQMFDYIILGDVLEHLYDPSGCIRKLRHVLKENGKLLISVPNLMHISVVEQLLDGRFSYSDSGLLDRDHIHFFTYKELVNLLKTAAFELANLEWMVLKISERQKQLVEKILSVDCDVKRFMLETFQYYACAKKLPDPVKGNVLILREMSPILDYVAEQFCNAYRRNGFRVYEMNCWKMGEKGYELFKLIREGLDHVLVFNNVGWQSYWNGMNLWDYFHIPCINYVLDHPFYYFDTLDKAPESGILACVDRSHVRYADRFYDRVKKSLYLPLAGEDLTGGHYKKLEERSISVLSAVGCKSKVDYPFDEFSWNVIREMQENTAGRLDDVIEEKWLLLSENDQGMGLKKVIEKYRWIDRYMKQWGRELAIRTLVEAQIDVYVCGTGWNQADLFTNPFFHWLGDIKQEECLKLMLDSKIVLNVMPWFREGLHDRVINAMLSGAVCVSEDNQCMRECFEEGEDYIAFSLEKIYQLPELVNKVLNHVGHYQEKVDQAYPKASRLHTWDSRIAQLEETLKEIVE